MAYPAPWAGLRRCVGFSAGVGDGYRKSGALRTCRDRGGEAKEHSAIKMMALRYLSIF